MKKLLLVGLLASTVVHAEKSLTEYIESFEGIAESKNGFIFIEGNISPINLTANRKTIVTGKADYGFHIVGNYKKVKPCHVKVSICMYKNTCSEKRFDYILTGNIDIKVNDSLKQELSYPDKGSYMTHTAITNNCDTEEPQFLTSFGTINIK